MMLKVKMLLNNGVVHCSRLSSESCFIPTITLRKPTHPEGILHSKPCILNYSLIALH